MSDIEMRHPDAPQSTVKVPAGGVDTMQLKGWQVVDDSTADAAEPLTEEKENG